MKRIITVQHTQSIHHINGMVGSWTDWDLTEKGKQQAECIARKLARELAAKTCILYSSDLLRARHTADAIGRAMNLPVHEEKALRERNLGRCVGKSVEWLRANLECQEKTVDDRIFSDAESRRDEWKRLRAFFDRVISNEEENIIIVSHGDLLSVFNAMWLRLPVESLETCELFGMAGGVSLFIENDDGKRMIKKMSDLSYMTE